MTTLRIPADDRGGFDFGWLKTFHTFSFGHYHDPERVHFGMVRVFNDDIVEPGKGFGTHPHDNMEIITIPLEGTVMHRDSMGHAEALRPGEVQVMSAGTGITHSEYNGSAEEALKLLQIWIIPERRDVEPRYEQMAVPTENGITTIVGPQDQGLPLWINQQAYMSLVRLPRGEKATYALRNDGNGVLAFVIEGAMKVGDDTMQRRDTIGITDVGQLGIEAVDDVYAVLIETPMTL